MDEASRAFVLRDSKWERSIGSGNELGSELYGAIVIQTGWSLVCTTKTKTEISN